MAYKLEFVDEINADDVVFENSGVKVIVDAKSLPYLEGAGARLRARGAE